MKKKYYVKSIDLWRRYIISNVVLHLFLEFYMTRFRFITFHIIMICAAKCFLFHFDFPFFLLFYLLHFEIAKSCEHSYYYVYMVVGKTLRKKKKQIVIKSCIKMNKRWYNQESSQMQRKKATPCSLFSGKRRKFHGVARTCWNYDYALINQIKLFSLQASNQYFVRTWNVCWMLWNANVIHWMSWKVFFTNQNCIETRKRQAVENWALLRTIRFLHVL